VTDLPSIAAQMAQEIRSYGRCHTTKVKCDCRHCRVLAMYEAYLAEKAIVQTPETAKEQVRESLGKKL
jgi:hypothetical protein